MITAKRPYENNLAHIKRPVAYTTTEGITRLMNPWQVEDIKAGRITCDLCLDVGLLNNNGAIIPCLRPNCLTGKAARKEQWRQLIASAEVPRTYADFTFESWQACIAPDVQRGKERGFIAAQLFAEKLLIHRHELLGACGLPLEGDNLRKRWLVLFGSVGTGKTGLMIAAANGMLDNGHSVVYVKLSRLFAALTATFGKDNAEAGAEEILGKYQRAKILCLDECNVQMKDGYSYYRQVVEDLLRHRYEQDLATIITMNVDQQGFEGMWGERTATVTKDTGIWVNVGGLTLRNADAPL